MKLVLTEVKYPRGTRGKSVPVLAHHGEEEEEARCSSPAPPSPAALRRAARTDLQKESRFRRASRAGAPPASAGQCPWGKAPGALPRPGDYDLNRCLTENCFLSQRSRWDRSDES